MEEEQIPEANKVPEDEIKKQKQLLTDLKQALKNSVKDTALRSFVVINKEYNHRIIDPKPAPEGMPESELTEEYKGFNSINEIAKDVFQTLDRTASNLLKYQSFKKKANLVPLKVVHPEPEAESRLDEPKEEPESKIPEPEVSKEATKPGDKSKAIDKSKVQEPPAEPEKEPLEKTQIPDETLAREWNYDSYKTVVNELPEDKKSIAGLLSA